MINVILMNNKKIDDDLHRVIFRGFFLHKALLVRDSSTYKTGPYNLIGVVMFLPKLLSRVSEQLN